MKANNSIPQAKAALEQAIAEGNTHLTGRFHALFTPAPTPKEELIDLDQF